MEREFVERIHTAGAQKSPGLDRQTMVAGLKLRFSSGREQPAVLAITRQRPELLHPGKATALRIRPSKVEN